MSVLRSINVVAQVVLTGTLARLLSPTDFGIYLFAATAAHFAGHLAAAGLGDLGTRLLGISGARFSVHRRSVLCRALLGMFWAWQPTFLLLGVALWWLVLPLMHGEFGAVPLEVLIPLFSASFGLRLLTTGIYRGLHRPVTATLVDGLLPVVITLLALLTLAAAGSDLSATPAIVLSMVATGAVAAVPAHRLVRRSGAPRWAILPRAASRFIGASAPMMLTPLTIGLGNQIAMFLIGTRGTAAELGVLLLAMQLTNAIGLIQNVLHQVAAPVIAELHHRRDPRALAAVAGALATWAAVPAIAGLVVFVIWGEPIVTLVFGVAYSPYVHVLTIVLLGRLAEIVSGPAYTALLMTGHARAYLTLEIVIMVLKPPVVLLGYELGGVTGAAWALSAVGTVEGAALMIVAKRLVGVWTAAFRAFRLP